MKINKAFTLVELMITIAIIGILSVMILASLSSSRSRGNDAAVKGNLHTVSQQAELYFVSNANSYGTQAFTTNAGCYSTGTGIYSNTTIKSAIAAAYKAGASAGVACVAAGSTFAVGARLNTESAAASWWCIDQTGKKKEVLISSVPFPTASFSCPS